jgi:hypothetical protein
MNDDQNTPGAHPVAEQDAHQAEAEAEADASCPYARLAEIWQDLSPIIAIITSETDDPDRRAVYERIASSLVREMHAVTGEVVERERLEHEALVKSIWDAVPRVVV